MKKDEVTHFRMDGKEYMGIELHDTKITYPGTDSLSEDIRVLKRKLSFLTMFTVSYITTTILINFILLLIKMVR